MTLADLEEFVTAHRLHGELTWWTTAPTPNGYRVEIACPCGVVFERWVLPQDAAEDSAGRGAPGDPGTGGRTPLTMGEE